MEILWQDRQLLVCLKSAGILAEEGEGAMPALLREATHAREIYCVHRLDRETGGLMVYAKTREAAASLSAAIAQGQLEKRYLAVLSGAPAEARGTLRDLLYRDARKNKSYVVQRLRRGVREAELRYELLETQGELSLVRVELVTGRSHQIRVQFASRGLPLVGDGRYGSGCRDWGLALWSASLAFPHPQSGQILRFTAPPPATEPWTRFVSLR